MKLAKPVNSCRWEQLRIVMTMGQLSGNLMVPLQQSFRTIHSLMRLVMVVAMLNPFLTEFTRSLTLMLGRRSMVASLRKSQSMVPQASLRKMLLLKTRRRLLHQLIRKQKQGQGRRESE